jgi:UDP-glucose 4-epimerase
VRGDGARGRHRLPGHEVFYVASADTIGGHPLEEIVRRYHGATQVELRPLERPAPPRSTARRRGGCSVGNPRRSWRDYLDADGRLKAGVSTPW